MNKRIREENEGRGIRSVWLEILFGGNKQCLVKVTKARERVLGGEREDGQKIWPGLRLPGIRLTNPIAVAGVAVANLGSARMVYQATLHQDPAQGSLHRHHHQIGASARCLRTLSS